VRSDALVPTLYQPVYKRPLPQRYVLVGQEQRTGHETASLLPRERGTSDRRAARYFFGEGGRYAHRTITYPCLPPTVGRTWNGGPQDPVSIRCNLRFSGTYGMEGTYLSEIAEKGLYIDFFS